MGERGVARNSPRRATCARAAILGAVGTDSHTATAAPLAGAEQEPPIAWHEQVVASLTAPGSRPVPMLAIDPRSGAIVASTPACHRYVDPTTVAHVDDLVATGVVARPDLDRLRARTAAALGRIDRSAGAETAEAWEERFRAHLPTGSVDLVVDLVLHHRWRYASELIIATIQEADAATGTSPDPAALAARGPLHTVYDRDARIVAIDPGWSVLYRSPERLVGTLAALLIHPSDLSKILPVAHELFAGRISRCSYDVRIAADDGSWVPIHVDLQTLASGSDDDRFVLATQTFVRTDQALIVPGTLSVRETEVVGALFDGLKVAQIAERDGVSVHTVRNQLKSIFRKLDVAGQAELLERYHRPPGT